MTLLEGSHEKVKFWRGSLPVTSRYTYGIAGERFFRTIKDEGRILGTYCKKCHRTYVPAAIFCERCLNELTEWVDVGTIGTVHTFTILYTSLDGKQHESPEIIVFVQMGDGGIVHKLGEVDPQIVSIDMQVEAIFKDKAEREGSILDISYFRPI